MALNRQATAYILSSIKHQFTNRLRSSKWPTRSRIPLFMLNRQRAPCFATCAAFHNTYSTFTPSPQYHQPNPYLPIPNPFLSPPSPPKHLPLLPTCHLPTASPTPPTCPIRPKYPLPPASFFLNPLQSKSQRGENLQIGSSIL